jgi:NAD(P)-dependent dehydrogenase (short-subunit alcohol dehydrogenase family)
LPNEKTDRVAFLTGVGPGLGASLARRFARGGYALGLVARHSDFLDQLTLEISGTGGRAIAVLADAGEPEEAKSAVARAGASLANQSPAAQREQFESRRIVWHYSGAACQRLASRVVRRICLRAGAMAA